MTDFCSSNDGLARSSTIEIAGVYVMPTYLCMYVCMYVCMNAYKYVCLCVCVSVTG